MKRIVEDYFATEDGRVWSNKTHRYISQRISPAGYCHVNLSIGGKCKTFAVHRLIASVYIPNPLNLPVINHLDGNKENNSINNLEWCSHKDNVQHAEKTGLTHHAKGKRCKHGHFVISDILKIRELYKQGLSQYKIASMYNVSRSAIQQILNYSTYKYC
jgi:DNA-binding transcriptional regulator YiaG